MRGIYILGGGSRTVRTIIELELRDRHGNVL